MRIFTQPAKLWWSSLCLLAVGTSLSAQVTFTNTAGLLQNVTGTSVADCAADMNQDGLDDVVRVMSNMIYVDYQNGDGTFTGMSYPLAVAVSPSWSICAADIDGNGWTDLLFGGGSSLSFVYMNDEGTAFTEDVQPEYIFTQRSTFQDIDNDGHLDAFACHDVDQSRPYRNDGNGVLSFDISLLPTLDAGGNYAAIWVDYDNDWDPDLYITKCRGGAPVGDPQRINLMYRNNGDGTFTSVGPEINMNDGEQSWATSFEDFDNDGDFDAFTVNHTAVLPIDGQTAGNRLMRNNGDGTFTNIINGSGITPGDLGAWNCDAGDFDNNGFVDIFSEMGTEMYWNNGDWTFTGGQLNFDSGGIGDFNNDGFLDVIAGNSLWLNNGNANNWVKFDLEGLVSNKDAIGARVEIYGEWGVQIREVRAGESFDPASSLHVYFGLGQADAIDQVIIKWPSGMITTMEDVAINTTHDVVEVGCMLDPVAIEVGGLTTICPGETVTLTAPAGTSYTWSNGASSQSIEAGAAGNYSVIVWDSEGCAAISNNVNISVIEEDEPLLTVEGEDVFCEGGSVVLISSPATTYTWSNGASGQSVAISEGGTYWVNVTGLCSGVSLQSEPVTIAVLNAPEPVAEDVTIGEPGTAILTASGNNLNWYATETSTEVLGTGPAFTTDFFSDAISYWVDATTVYGGEVENGGKETNSGGGGLPSTGGRLYFNVTEPFTLQQVTMYVPDNGVAGPRTIQLFDQGGTLLQETTVDLLIGQNTVDVGFEIEVGNGYQLGLVENNCFRNNAGVSYPYSIGSVGQVYDSSFGTSYYYYFYNWVVQKESVECVSDRVEVTAMVVGVDELTRRMGLSVYPNPAEDVLNITMKPGYEGARIQVIDALGRTVKTTSLNLNSAGTMTMDLSDLAPGAYQLMVRSGEEQAVIDVLVR